MKYQNWFFIFIYVIDNQVVTDTNIIFILYIDFLKLNDIY